MSFIYTISHICVFTPNKFLIFSAMGHNSWVHCDEVRVSFGNDPFIECIVQLKWVQDNGTLTVSNLDGTITRIVRYNLTSISSNHTEHFRFF